VPASAQPPPTTAQPPRTTVHTGELISAASSLLLLLVMFALEWYGVVGLAGRRRSGITTAENAWSVLTYVRWLMLLTIAVALGSVILHATQKSHGARTDTGLVVAVLGILTAALLVYRVLIVLPETSSVVDVKIGAVLGMACAIGIALGGYESIREQRAQSAGVVQRSRTRRARVPRAGIRPMQAGGQRVISNLNEPYPVTYIWRAQ
jgi:hypothetical protein